jgi:hypothetical protein
VSYRCPSGSYERPIGFCFRECAVRVSRRGTIDEFPAVRVQAEDNLRKAERIINLYSDLKPRITDLTRSRYAINALDWIFRYPIFSSAHFATRAGIPPKTARRFLKALRDGEILQTIIARRGRRASVLAFPAVLRVAEGRDVV